MERDWVRKFKSGEYLHKWKDYETILIGGPYSENIGIGEEKFAHCMGFFCGIGDVDWWIKDEIEKLTKEQEEELEWICKYKTYLKDFITIDLVRKISNFYGCETHHIYRTGNKGIFELCTELTKYYNLIEKNSKNDRGEDWLSFIEKDNPFYVLSFDEYKIKNTVEEQQNENIIPSLEVIGFDVYKDGGTILIETNEGDIFIDHRLNTMTEGKLYTKYPDDNTDNIISWDEEEKLLPRLVESLKLFESDFYGDQIKHLIETIKYELDIVK